MSVATLTLVPPVTLPPVRCAPWCSEGRGHIHADAPEDQFCYSNVVDDSMSIGKDGEVDVSLITAPGQPVVVELSVAGNGNNACLSMTVGEARRFALAILATVDLVARCNADPVTRLCVDCGVTFPWDESPDDDRCAHCAAVAGRDVDVEAVAL